MKTRFVVTSQIISHFFKTQRYRSTALLLAVCMMLNMLPNFSITMAEDNSGSFQAKQAENNGNYAILNWSGTPGSKFVVEKSNNTDDIYETIPLKYSIKVLNVYPNIGNNLKNWMQSNSTGSPTINGTKYTMTVDEVPIYYFNSNPSAYMGTAGNWKYDVIYFGGYDSNNNYDISLLARNSLEQFIKSGGGVLLGHDTASLDFVNFKYIALTYLNLQASTLSETYLPPSSPDYIPTYGNTKVKVARKGLLTNYPYALGDVGTVMTVPESHSYHEFASGNIWFTYNGTNSNWDPSKPEMTNYKGKTGTNNFYLTTLNNVAMIQTGHSGGAATLDEQKILTNTLYYLAQTTNQTTFDDHSAQDLTAPSKVIGPITVSESKLSFTDSVDAGNNYSYKLYTVNDVSGTKTDTGETAHVTVKTGLKGYSYVINQSQTATNIDTTVEITTASIDVSTLTVGNYYLHIRAVDNAGNASDESVLAFTVKSTQPTGSVTLNKPVFTNDKSGYTFKSATINNFTGINSITFSISKGTTVKSVPSFLTPSSKLESIDGDTRTFAYVFDKSVTVSQAEEFIRGIVFNYVPGAEISITVDNNETKLPDGAKITKFNHSDGTEHYYMYVPSNFISWTDAYNKAKSYTYMGLKGYLTTITSKEEDEILTNISTISAWSAGTRYLNADASKLIDPSSISVLTRTSNYYYWACGPEAGTIYYNSILPTLNPGAGYTGYNGAYNNWGANPGQPDAYGGVEVCMQVNWPYDIGASGKMRWNDLPNGGLPNIDLVKGYFVEFSNYAGGVISTYASDKTAVGTFNLVIDGGVEEVATVHLNAPLYGSNKSVFSFANAEVKNINTIYSITIKLNNYTNVLSKPSVPAVSNELSNIAGATNTITYQFNSGISLADAQNFLRGLKFRYGGLKTSSTTNVSVTIDGNKTNLPTDASITEFNGHYYMYVNECLSWTDAYNKAKTYCYMGMTGYLATITSAQEDKVLDNISMNGAWSAGTRYTGVYDTNIAPSGALDNYFKWACGPEAGTNYYYFNATSNKYPVNGAYNGFVDTGEPNGYVTNGTPECCMQVHYKSDLYNSSITWNDLRDIVFRGAYDGPGKVGYFVEFSDYDGGRVEGFVQSVNGVSTVPIDVAKGDIFTTVKEVGTYYVDTLLKAFDRNITRITVNGITFTSGNKLAGNKNTTYNIVATDLEGNTSTMTVNMKTIASISEPIKYLTVNNVQMSNKETILAVKAALLAIDTTDATINQVIEINNAIQNCNSLYFALFNATATTPNGTNGWYKNGIGDITLTAPDGFKISTSISGVWTSSITVDNTDGASKTVVYYLKEVSTNDISNEKTFNYKVDTKAPTGTITIKTNQFKTFIKNISFGLFYKNSVDVSIVATDTLSTPISISYQKVKDGESYNESGTWTTGSSFIVRANEKFYVYAKLVDNAGNVVIINSDGVVVFTDSTQGISNISFTKTSTKDVAATVNLNGNTVKDIKNGISVIDSSNYTVASDGTITFKASYLDSLKVGTYTLTVSYNSMGEIYVPGSSIGDAPASTTLTLVIKAKDMSDNGGASTANISINPGSTTYTGNAFNPTVAVTDGTKMLAKDVDYTIIWPNNMTDVGVKTLTVTFMGDYSGTITKSVNITNASIIDKTNKIQSKVFDNTQKTIATPTGITVNNQKLTVMYSIDGKAYNLASAPTFTAAGKYIVYYQLIAPNHNTVTGQIEFIINAATDNIISNLSINNWMFGQKANTPTATVKYGTPIFTYSDSENGIYTDTIPTGAGTYFVKASVAATADYNECVAKTSFIILSKLTDSQSIAIGGLNAYYLFTGEAITPEPTVTVDGTILKKDIDYTVVYDNNTEVGMTAKVKVILMGNYSGATEKTFEIRYGEINDTDIKNVITLPEFNSEGWYNKDINIKAIGDWTLCTSPNGSFGTTLVISDDSSKTGSDYTFYIKKADGSVYERTLTYKLDKTAPTGTISIGNNSWNRFLNNITFGLFFNSTQTVSIITDSDLSGIANVEYAASSCKLTLEEVKALTNWTTGRSVDVTVVDAKQFIYYARITDNAGNVSYISTDGVEFDTTVPIITGIIDGSTYYTTHIAEVTDKNIKSITLNGNLISSPVTLDGNTDSTYTIVVTDRANNTITYTITMKTIASLSTTIDSITIGNVKSSDTSAIEIVKTNVGNVDTTNASQAEKDALKEITDKCNLLLSKISDTAAEVKRITDAINGYNLSTIKSSDKATIDKLIEDLDRLTDSDNLTSDEANELNIVKQIANKLLTKISDTTTEINRITEAVNGYDIATVKSTDIIALEQFAKDVDTLVASGNLTEGEITALNGIKTKVTDLIAKVSGTAELIKKLTDTINGYRLDEVKSTDKASIEQIIADINSLVASENLTEDEKAALGIVKNTADSLLEKITEAAEASTKQEINDAKSINDNNVKPNDKELLEKAKEALEAAIKGYEGNYTEVELTSLKEQLETVSAVLVAIENSEKVITSIIALPDAADVKASDKDVINAAKAAYDSLTDAEKAMVGSEYVEKLNIALKAFADLGNNNPPQTDDTNNMFLWVVFLLVSGCVFTILSIHKKRKKDR